MATFFTLSAPAIAFRSSCPATGTTPTASPLPVSTTKVLKITAGSTPSLAAASSPK